MRGCIARQPGRGIGTALLKAVEAEARAGGFQRLWLVTTNYNQRAVEFYEGAATT